MDPGKSHYGAQNEVENTIIKHPQSSGNVISNLTQTDCTVLLLNIYIRFKILPGTNKLYVRNKNLI